MEFVKRKADEIAKSINLRKKPFTVVRLPLDIGVSLRYIKCINSINTLLTCLIHFEQQEIANHARLKLLKFNLSREDSHLFRW